MKPNPEDAQHQFSQAYDNYAEAIFRHCYFRIYDRDRARDLTQETFMRTWDYWSSGKPIHNMKAFLYKTATNLIINDIKRRKPSTSLDHITEQTGFEGRSDGHDDILREVDADILARRMQNLSDPDRELLTMRYINGCTIKEMAAILNERENVISVRIHRARARLRDLFDPPEKKDD